jgi:hypothetical protein
MSDDIKKPLNNIEQQRFSIEKEVDKEHFLEQGFEQEQRSEKVGETVGESMAQEQEDIFGEAGTDGGDLVSQGAYNQQQAARQLEIEKILEKDLGDIYVSLPPEKQRQFKIVGEQTAAAINELYNKGKLTIKKIIDLIRKWLSLVPGVNRFFLEQEAKIKADEIKKLTEEEKI